jgi:hypothetical protein
VDAALLDANPLLEGGVGVDQPSFHQIASLELSNVDWLEFVSIWYVGRLELGLLLWRIRAGFQFTFHMLRHSLKRIGSK